ncbi:geranylgeranyl-diphosphate geranylgeranyltransferase [Halobacteriales archaeon SW_10_66_29]|nr:MAG: geranylgeranyl-diphosphate geranylgeranyltransferase [Halobacteriales archaeon SW_10_66_29]
MNDSQRKRGKTIHRETGKTFYYATRLLPERIREQTYVLYGFFRIADEVVDDGFDREPSAQRAELESIRRAALGEEATEEPVIAAFAEIRAQAGIPDEEVDAFIDAMIADIDTDRYETDDDLESYMRGSAAAVGNMMTAIMEPDQPETARPHAMALGEAFQLTNFIRDVREDIEELGRVYLPLTTLRRNDVTVEQLRRGEVTPGFRRAIQSELARAETRYRHGVQGIEYLPSDCQFAVLLSAVLYAEHHRLIRAQEFDVLSTRPSLSRPRKLWLIARTWWNWRRYRDPVTVFRRVSAIPSEEAPPDETATGGPDHGVPSPD